MRKDFDEMYRLGLYGNGIERIKLKKAVQIIQKASASQVKIVDIGHDNFDSACEALELGSVDMAVVDMAQLIRMEKNDENLPYGVVISGVLKRGDSRYVMIRKRHAKDLIENAVVATDSYSKTERIKHMYDGISCVVETDIRKCIEKLDTSECDAVFVLLEDIKAEGYIIVFCIDIQSWIMENVFLCMVRVCMQCLLKGKKRLSARQENCHIRVQQNVLR